MSLAITGIGLCTAVGMDAPSTAAAVRARVSRFSSIRSCLVPSDSGRRSFEPARGARLPIPVPEAPVRCGRALRAAVAEGLAHAGLPADLGGTVWSLDLGVHAERAVVLEASGLPAPAGESTGESERLEQCAALERIIRLAERGTEAAEAAVIACADSLAGDRVLHELARRGLLKSGANPDGALPGEAAAALVVEPAAGAERRGAPVLATVEAWGRGQEPVPLRGQAPSTARGLTEALTAALAGLEGGGGEVDLTVADLTGERQRAQEWALAEHRAFPYQKRDRQLWYPAASVGDCGTAMGAVLLALTSIALARGYAGTDHAAVVASDERGARRAVVLRRADGAPGADRVAALHARTLPTASELAARLLTAV